MKLEKWALIAEIVTSFAVVVSLIVLIVELRENTATIEASPRESAAARIEERSIAVAGNADLLEVLAKARNGGDVDLRSPEGVRLRFFLGSILTGVEEAFLQYRDGRLGNEYFQRRAARAIPLNFANPAGRAYLEIVRADGAYDTEFFEWIYETYPEVGD